MSIEKLNFQEVIRQHIPFTLVCNQVIQKITNRDALAVWVYLLSMPTGWRVNKVQLMKHFKMGKRCLEGIFSYLRKTNLIEYIHTRDDKKRIKGWAIHVLCGDKFDENGHLKDEKATPQDLHPVDNSTPQVSTPVAFQPCSSDPCINTTMLIKEKEQHRKEPTSPVDQLEEQKPKAEVYTKATYLFRPDDYETSYQRNFHIQACFNKFIEFIKAKQGHDQFVREDWIKWRNKEKDMNKSRRKHDDYGSDYETIRERPRSEEPRRIGDLL